MKSGLCRLMILSLVVGLMSLCPLSFVRAEQTGARQVGEPDTETQFLRMVINRSLDTLMGANLVMLAQMKMSSGLDEEVLARGRAIMERGKKGIQALLVDPKMQASHKDNPGDAAPMEYVQAVAAAVMQVTDALEKVKLEELNPDTMTMQYFNILINQALEMALEGSNLITMGQKGVTESVVKESVERGGKMQSEARTLIIAVMGSKAMSEMHSRESGKMPAMGLTHQLAMDTLELLDLLEAFPEGENRSSSIENN